MANFVQTLQGVGEWLTAVMLLVSYLGDIGFFVPTLMVVFWCVSPRAGARAAVLLLLSAGLNDLLKLVFHDPRPYWTDPRIRGLAVEPAFGMPSGHAQNSAVIWGLLAATIRRPATWVLTLAVVFLVGTSRVYLGVHSTGQVLVGWMVGAILLCAALCRKPLVLRRWRACGLGGQVGLSLAVSLACLGLMSLATAALADWRMPSAWTRAIAAAGGGPEPTVPPHAGFVLAGLTFGLLAGLSWLAGRGWFDPAGSWWRRLARIPVGLAGAAVLWLVLRPLASDGVIGYLVDYLRFGLVGCWLVAGAPEVFIRLGLAGRAEQPRCSERATDVFRVKRLVSPFIK